MRFTQPASLPVPRQRGFTLVEVMVSIAIALILILGVNQVFRASSMVAGAGQALSRSQQMSRTIKTIITNDLSGGVWGTDSILVIRNEQRYAYRSSADQQGAADPSQPSSDPAFVAYNGTIPPYFVNYRSHRVDRIGFFSRGLFERQTSATQNPNSTSVNNPPTLTTPFQANEAWVWYGHLALPNEAMNKLSFPQQWLQQPPGPIPAARFFGPGEPNSNTATNDDNFFADDWTLGRVAILMAGNDASLRNGVFTRDALLQSNSSGSLSSPAALSPLAIDSSSGDSNADGFPDPAFRSLHDIAEDSISNYTDRLFTFVPLNWCHWLIGVDYSQPNNPVDHRYQACPFVPTNTGRGQNSVARLNPVSVSWASPVMTKACVHFIVEYAGNYLTQTTHPGFADDGTIKFAQPDTINQDHIDFISVRDPTGAYIRKIRWYGFPRDVNGQAGIQFDDVIPYRDVIAFAGATNTDPNYAHKAPFEIAGADFPAPASQNALPNYQSMGAQNQPNADLSYTCAWGPYNPAPTFSWPTPAMLRITVAIDDPSGRLGESQSYEYIIDLRQ